MLAVLAVVTVGGFSGLSADAGEVAMSFLGLDEMGPLQGISFAVLPAMVGMAAYSLNPNLESPDMAFPYLATEVFPLALGAFLLVAGALVADAVIGYITTMISTILTGLFVASVLGRFWRRSTWQGGMAAIVAGSATSLTVQAVASWSEFWGSPVLPSLFMATVAGVFVSLVTPPTRVSDEEALAQLAAERAQIDVGTTVKGAEA